MMHLGLLEVDNYRCLCTTNAPLSRFTTIIGENNSGKSSVLQALILFIKGTKLSPADYNNPKRDIVIKVTLEDVTDADLARLEEDHIDRITQLVSPQRKLCFIRRYKTDGTSSLKCSKPVPKEDRFRPKVVKEMVKGLKGPNLKTEVEHVFPELQGKLASLTQAAVIRQIEALGMSLPPEQLEYQEADLPAGCESSAKALLPEPVYIPAVIDLPDEVKTRETASFGRILSVLLNMIEPKFGKLEEEFATLNKKLNISKADDAVVDERFDEVRQIEQTIEGHLREGFPSVSLQIEIPPPDLKTVLSTAKIVVNDGVEGIVESKGDGLKRAVIFAILRAYATLSAKPEWQRGVDPFVKTQKRGILS